MNFSDYTPPAETCWLRKRQSELVFGHAFDMIVLMRVVVTRIEQDGTMQRRLVDTAQQSDPRNWEVLTDRALAVRPPYRPVPGTALYHICVDDDTIQVGEYDLEGPLRDLVTVVLAMGRELLDQPAGRQAAVTQVRPFPSRDAAWLRTRE